MDDLKVETVDEESPLISMVTVVSLAATVMYCVVGLVFATVFKARLSREDFWILVWLVYDFLIHLTLEGPFVVISLLGTVRDSSHFSSLVWKEYAKADARWGVSDPTIVSLEILTVTIVQVFVLGTIYGIVQHRPYRHFMQICLCACELYGGWITFCPEWLTGSANLRTDNVLHLWIYLVFFNMLWVVIPLYLLYHSWVAMTAVIDKNGEVVSEKQETTVTTNVTKVYHTRSKDAKKSQ
ncbi:emopamil-binding protein-like [Dreissena polymorpha]|uniref:EXPERA domain-containing protein n=1 Tax=Dreissena polymorpha TaxID=45954 RepID=A0A9D4G0P5_DREPO|nr:emopamil-binding protein-like [Dreissena polymorpha]XP_052214897.1 emopamil-binding protein-like [Dreissena polymorpha]KAH3806445.1 hypothetical protein DPMN_134766 [Dreissena polymorpha]